MTHKAAYIWGPVSSFSGALAAVLLQKGWHVHVATKSSLNLFTMAPLDLRSAAQDLIEKAMGGHEHLRLFQDRLRLLDAGEVVKGTTYDAVIFAGLPSNYDEPRAPRAPWAAAELQNVAKFVKGVPIFIISSLWAAVQPDGVVPEEVEFERRKPLSHWEGICQQYENKLLSSLHDLESSWHLIRLPLLGGSSADGRALNFSGLFPLLREGDARADAEDKQFKLGYNPDSTLWFLPVDNAVHLFWRLLEDGTRPRICNLVSTQSTLNRELMDYLARALGYEGAAPAASDALSLPGTLRKILNDNLHVKTRNLFEVTGRYHYSPTKLDESYFEKLLAFGKHERWGRTFMEPPRPPEPVFASALAGQYFQSFLPTVLSEKDLKELTSGGTTIGFYVRDPEACAFVLRADSDKAVVERLTDASTVPKVRLHLSGAVMMDLARNRLNLHKALLTRCVQLEASVFDGFRVANALTRIFKEHAWEPPAKEEGEESAPVPETAAT